MKKAFLLLALLGSLLFINCSSDSNDADLSSRSCNLLGVVPIEITDNGDGTATVTAEGESETIDLEGSSFDVFAEGLCSGDLEFDFGL